MSFWQKIKQTLRSFMNGRHGADQLSTALVWVGLGIYLLSAITGWAVLGLVSMAMYVYAIYRMFSRNNEKRTEENRKYLAWKSRWQTQLRQARTRFKNRKQFKYFRCPNCHAWLKLPRKAGMVTVTCGRCKNSFTEKA